MTSKVLHIALIFIIAGCSSVVSTNDSTFFPVPRLSSSETLANIEIKESIKGKGCASKFLHFIYMGDNKYLSQSGKIPTKDDLIEKAKASATFDALNVKDELTTDLLIHPVWLIEDDNYLILKKICAKVVGYRGVITGFSKPDTLTSSVPLEERNSTSIKESSPLPIEEISATLSKNTPPTQIDEKSSILVEEKISDLTEIRRSEPIVEIITASGTKIVKLINTKP